MGTARLDSGKLGNLTLGAPRSFGESSTSSISFSVSSRRGLSKIALLPLVGLKSLSSRFGKFYRSVVTRTSFNSIVYLGISKLKSTLLGLVGAIQPQRYFSRYSAILLGLNSSIRQFFSKNLLTRLALKVMATRGVTTLRVSTLGLLASIRKVVAFRRVFAALSGIVSSIGRRYASIRRFSTLAGLRAVGQRTGKFTETFLTRLGELSGYSRRLRLLRLFTSSSSLVLVEDSLIGIIRSFLTRFGAAVNPYSQVFIGGTYRTLGTSQTMHNTLNSGYYWEIGHNDSDQIISEPGFFDKLFVEVSSAPGAGNSWNFSLAVNGVVSGLSATVSGVSATSASGLAYVPISAGDEVCIKRTRSGTPSGSTYARWSTRFNGNTSGRSSVVNHTFADDGTTYIFPQGGSGDWTFSDEDDAYGIMPVSGTFRDLRVSLVNAPGSGYSYTNTLRVNLVSTALAATVSGTSTSAYDLDHSVSVSEFDKISFRGVGTVGMSGSQEAFGMMFVSDVPGQNICLGRGTVAATSTGMYWPISDGYEPSGTAINNRSQLVCEGKIHILRGELKVSPLSSVVATLYKNGVATDLSILFGPGDSQSSDITHIVEVADGDSICMVVVNGESVSETICWGFVHQPLYNKHLIRGVGKTEEVTQGLKVSRTRQMASRFAKSVLLGLKAVTGRLSGVKILSTLGLKSALVRGVSKVSRVVTVGLKSILLKQVNFLRPLSSILGLLSTRSGKELIRTLYVVVDLTVLRPTLGMSLRAYSVVSGLVSLVGKLIGKYYILLLGLRVSKFAGIGTILNLLLGLTSMRRTGSVVGRSISAVVSLISSTFRNVGMLRQFNAMIGLIVIQSKLVKILKDLTSAVGLSVSSFIRMGLTFKTAIGFVPTFIQALSVLLITRLGLKGVSERLLVLLREFVLFEDLVVTEVEKRLPYKIFEFLVGLGLVTLIAYNTVWERIFSASTGLVSKFYRSIGKSLFSNIGLLVVLGRRSGLLFIAKIGLLPRVGLGMSMMAKSAVIGLRSTIIKSLSYMRPQSVIVNLSVTLSRHIDIARSMLSSLGLISSVGYAYAKLGAFILSIGLAVSRTSRVSTLRLFSSTLELLVTSSRRIATKFERSLTIALSVIRERISGVNILLRIVLSVERIRSSGMKIITPIDLLVIRERFSGVSNAASVALLVIRERSSGVRNIVGIALSVLAVRGFQFTNSIKLGLSLVVQKSVLYLRSVLSLLGLAVTSEFWTKSMQLLIARIGLSPVVGRVIALNRGLVPPMGLISSYLYRYSGIRLLVSALSLVTVWSRLRGINQLVSSSLGLLSHSSRLVEFKRVFSSSLVLSSLLSRTIFLLIQFVSKLGLLALGSAGKFFTQYLVSGLGLISSSISLGLSYVRTLLPRIGSLASMSRNIVLSRTLSTLSGLLGRIGRGQEYAQTAIALLGLLSRYSKTPNKVLRASVGLVSSIWRYVFMRGLKTIDFSRSAYLAVYSRVKRILEFLH